MEHDGKIEQIQIDDAKLQNVSLKGATLPRCVEKTVPKIGWINQFSAAYYQNIVEGNSFNFINGHAPELAYGAVNLKRISRGQNIPKVVLMVNRLPKTDKGSIDKDLICSWMIGTDIVFSIGETDSYVLKRFIDGKLHNVYIPIHPLQPFGVHSDSASTVAFEPNVRTQKITVMVGRKEHGHYGINIKLVIAAVAQAVQKASDGDAKTEYSPHFCGG